MRLLKVFVILFIVLLMSFILMQNADIVTLNLLTKTYENVPMFAIIVGTLSLGILIGFGIALTTILAGRNELRLLNGENRKLADELNSLRNMAIDEGIYEINDEVE